MIQLERVIASCNRIEKSLTNTDKDLGVFTFEISAVSHTPPLPHEDRINQAFDILSLYHEEPESDQKNALSTWLSNELLELHVLLRDNSSRFNERLEALEEEMEEEEQGIFTTLAGLGFQLQTHTSRLLGKESREKEERPGSSKKAIEEWREAKRLKDRQLAEEATHAKKAELNQRKLDNRLQAKQREIVLKYKEAKREEEKLSKTALLEAEKMEAKLRMKQLEELGIIDRIREKEIAYLEKRKARKKKDDVSCRSIKPSISAPSKLFHQTASLLERTRAVQRERMEREEQRLMGVVIPQRLTVYGCR